jgi:hypothetical protein
MESQSVVPEEWVASIDLKDIYLHVPILPDHHQWLRFAIQRVSYQWKVLPFGLSIAPIVFTKVLAPVLAAIRLKGVHIHPYLDNLLLRVSSPLQLTQASNISLKMITQAGYMVNLKKSELTPT